MSVLVRCVVAAVGMMLSVFASLSPFVVPGFEEWMSVERPGVEGLVQLVVELARHALPLVVALALLSVCARGEKLHWRSYLGEVDRGRSARTLVAATAFAAGLSAAAMTLVQSAGWDADRAGAGVQAVPLVLLVVFGLARAFLLQGIQEELWFRGFAFRGFRDRPWLVLTATTVGFTVLHLSSSGGQESTAERFLYLVLPLGMGFFAGVMRWTTGAVSGAVGVHGGVHTGLLLPAALGWSMGPAGWTCVGLALVVAGVVQLLLRRPWETTPAAAPAAGTLDAASAAAPAAAPARA